MFGCDCLFTYIALGPGAFYIKQFGLVKDHCARTSIHLRFRLGIFIHIMELLPNLNTERILVFGYGSLTWKPNIDYSRKHIGFIQGYKRRFWQGNTTHRGTEDRIGRVATLVPDEEGTVWGVAFEICGVESVNKALSHLCVREMTLGGYNVITTTFQPRDPGFNPQNVLVYMATSQNNLFLGEQHVDAMATEIYKARGTAGSNSEYVTKLADFIRNHIPEDDDSHLFELDHRLRALETLNSDDESFIEQRVMD